ncbi:MAG: hypothetical protein JXA66_02975, partial [Oligoflexia bacterium]|nr:hypothetical protein [Oligoflexia bacterium]
MMKKYTLILFVIILMTPGQDAHAKPDKYKFKKEKKATARKKSPKTLKAKPALPPQETKTPVVLRKKSIHKAYEPALYNDFKKLMLGEQTDDYDEDWHDRSRVVKGTLTGDFSTFGSEIKGVMKKHQFTILGVPYSIQGIPIVYPSKKTGLNLGARLSVYDLKYENPYRYNLMLQYWISDRGKK